MAAVTICRDFGAQKNKVATDSTVSPSICYEVMGPDAMILVFWMLSFKPTFSFSCFTFIKRLFGSSSLFSIRVVSSAYLRLLIFLLAILIPACASSSPAFLLMYSAYKLNKQGDNMQPWCTPFPVWNQSVFPCPVLTVASLPIYRLLYNIVVVFAVYQHESARGIHVSPPSWWTDKEVMVHIHNGILLSYKRNTFESVLMRRMNLEPIIQSEVNQKEKDNYHILRHIHGTYIL